MAVGDVVLVVYELGPGAAVDLVVTARLKIVSMGLTVKTAPAGYYISKDGINFFETPETTAKYVPPGARIRIQNKDSVPRPYIFNAIVY